MSTAKTTKTAKVETKAADKESVKVVKAEAAKAETKVEAVKAEATKTETKAAPAKKATAKKATAAKTEAKADPAKKAAAKTTTAKAAPAKKAAKATEEVFIEYADSQISTSDIVARVVEATGKKATSIKALNVYVQPETGKIYYTADGETGEISYWK